MHASRSTRSSGISRRVICSGKPSSWRKTWKNVLSSTRRPCRRLATSQQTCAKWAVVGPCHAVRSTSGESAEQHVQGDRVRVRSRGVAVPRDLDEDVGEPGGWRVRFFPHVPEELGKSRLVADLGNTPASVAQVGIRRPRQTGKRPARPGTAQTADPRSAAASGRRFPRRICCAAPATGSTCAARATSTIRASRLPDSTAARGRRWVPSSSTTACLQPCG